MLQALASVVGLLVVKYAKFLHSGCGFGPGVTRCDFGALTVADALGRYGTYSACALALVLTVILAVRGRRIWWIPLAGTVAIALVVVTSVVVMLGGANLL